MSYISEMLGKHAHIKKEFSISEMEKGIADVIVNRAQRHIEDAIKRGKTSIRMIYFNHREGVTNIKKSDNTLEYYLKNDDKHFVHRLWDVIGHCYDESETNLMMAIDANEKKLNLKNIENHLREGLLNLGAKEVVVYVRFCDYVWVNPSRGLFGRGKKTPLMEYKVCYEISW